MLLSGACAVFGGADSPRCSDTAAPGVNACVVVVPDPRPGDLRLAEDADVLPADYVAPDAHTTMRDVAYGDAPAQKLDLYLPAQPSAPVVMYLHSGGWVGGERAPVPSMALRFVERGYAVVSVGYRLAPEHPFPASVEDVKRALRWLRVYSQEEGLIDGDRIVVFGTSAGGHLASIVAATPGRFEPTDLTASEAQFESTVSGVVSAVGPTDLVAFYESPHPWAKGLTEALLGCDPCESEQLVEASLFGYLDGDLPPAYWVYGEDDDLVDSVSQGAAAASAWAENSDASSSWYDSVAECGHNIECDTRNQRSLEQFVDRAVGSGP